ncbi:MAG: NAD(P)H-binding protein, partial [Planctomycetes bacterium]|nr:NAD(P)H-binding protein [Planctomycetota bacterium]
MSTEPTRLFLTGASGYVGRRLVESLLARADVEITALVRDSSASPSLQHPRLRWVPGDLVQAGPWAQALANQDRV